MSSAIAESFLSALAEEAKHLGDKGDFVFAAASGDVKKVKELLDKRINPNCGIFGLSALHWAAYFNHKAIIYLLREAENIDLNATDRMGITPLSLAAQAGHVGAVLALASAEKTDKNLADCDGRTPLHWAIMNCNTDAAIALIGNRLDPNVVDNIGRSPLMYAVNCADTMVITCLFLFPSHIDINHTDALGQTALDMARECPDKVSREEIINLLEAYGAV